MSNAARISKVSFLTAAVSTVIVAALLGAAALGIWTENLRYHPTPRINSLTVGLGLFPLPAFAWVVYMWTCKPTDGYLDVALRVLLTGALVAGVYYCVLTAMVDAFFVS